MISSFGLLHVGRHFLSGSCLLAWAMDDAARIASIAGWLEVDVTELYRVAIQKSVPRMGQFTLIPLAVNVLFVPSVNGFGV